MASDTAQASGGLSLAKGQCRPWLDRCLGTDSDSDSDSQAFHFSELNCSKNEREMEELLLEASLEMGQEPM